MLTVDPGLIGTGWALWKPGAEPKDRVRASGTFKPQFGGSQLERLAELYRDIHHAFCAPPTDGPYRALVEKPPTARIYWGRMSRDKSRMGAMNASALAVHHMARGVVLAALVNTGMEVEEIPAGKTTKRFRQTTLATLLPGRGSNEHERDALWLGIVHADLIGKWLNE